PLVTGVQTCALPIYQLHADVDIAHRDRRRTAGSGLGKDRDPLSKLDRRLVSIQRGDTRSCQDSRLALGNERLEVEIQERRVNKVKGEPSARAVQEDVPKADTSR